MSYPFPCEPESLISFRRRLNFKSMIGGIGHDVQKIKVRLEELQRDVSASPCHPPPLLSYSTLSSPSRKREIPMSSPVRRLLTFIGLLE